MIRRDYILRMIEEFIAALRKLQGQKGDRRWEEAEGTLDEQFQRLVGTDAAGIAQLSETEVLAKLLQGEASLFVRDKTLLLTSMLKEAGDVALAQDQADQARAYYVKGLNLLLDVLARSDSCEFPEFVPRVEMFVAGLADQALPIRTQALLMQHYETTGQYAKAEDALFAMLEIENDGSLLDFGIAFYERLKGRADDELEQGNLPRAELESGLAELKERRAEVKS